MDHIGIDVHKRESQIYILAEGGEVIERRIRTEPERFDAVLGTRPRARIVLEASTDSEWVARCLEALGHEVIVADPNFAPMYATRTRKVKTDRRDARALAEACLLGAYRPAHRLSDPQRHVRGRLVVRDALVRTRTRYISIIRALLRQHGYRVPSGSADHFVHRVQRLPLPGRLRSVVAPAARPHAPPQRAAHVLRRHDRTPRRPGSARAASCAPSPASAPSPPPPSSPPSMMPSASPTRISSKPTSASVPGERSSGETQRRGAITKAGHSRTRWLLIQAAVSILRRRPPQAEELRTWALRIAARRGQTGGRGRPRPSPRRHPLCAAARWQRLRAPARSASASSRGGAAAPVGM
jgi:transposase